MLPTCVQGLGRGAVGPGAARSWFGRAVGGERYLGGQSKTNGFTKRREQLPATSLWPRRLAETRGDCSGARKKGRMCCRRDLE